MAPPANTWLSSREGTNHAMDAALKGHDPAKLYKDAYTHGYTEGYIAGHGQAELVKQTQIAIVGMSCRLPGNVSTPDEFWELCSRARRQVLKAHCSTFMLTPLKRMV